MTTEKEWWGFILIPPSILQQPPELHPLPGIHGADGDWQLGANFVQIGEGWLNKCVFLPGGGWRSHRVPESQNGLVVGT